MVIATPSAEIQSLVDSGNAQHRATYAEIAARNGATVDAVAALAGEKLIARTPAGPVGYRRSAELVPEVAHCARAGPVLPLYWTR